MTEQTKAQRLADTLERMVLSTKWDKEAAAELRRLDALNAELVEALEEAEFVLDNNPMVYPEKSNAIAIARVTLAKAKEQT